MLERSRSGLAITLRPTAGEELIEPIAVLLDSVPLFAAAGPAVVQRLADHAERVRLTAGEWLFRTGDEADAVYVVASGRVEAVNDDGDAIRAIGRGEVIGELALLSGEPRSASVRARRDSELVRLAGADLDALLRSDPNAALALARVIGGQLRQSRPHVAAQPVPATIALVPLHDDLPVREVRTQLVSALRRHGRVIELDGSGAASDAERARLLDRVEREHDQVLLVAGNASETDPWTAFSLRQADRVIALAGPGGTPHPDVSRRLHGADLAYAGRAGISAWSEAIEPGRRHLVGSNDGVERMARRLTGNAVGVVLSGGGARGTAHLGVIEELLAAGVEIDRIGGTSMGALVSGLIASGLSVDEAAARLEGELVARRPLNDYTIPLVALTRGRKGEAMIRRLFGDQLVEELDLDFFSVSSDLVRNEAVEHRSGSLAEAVGASVAIPGIVPPVEIGERLLVDGGVLDNLPVARMPRDEGPVIAVNVSASAAPPPPPPVRRRRPRARRLAAATRRVVTGVEEPRMGFGQALMRSVTLGSMDPDAVAEHADLLIAPDVTGVDLLNWSAMPEMRAAGRAAARRALETAPAPLRPTG
jgi:predicted acylesterase/phospholipase RssA/CRP-like cAMP-binding protein